MWQCYYYYFSIVFLIRLHVATLLHWCITLSNEKKLLKTVKETNFIIIDANTCFSFLTLRHCIIIAEAVTNDITIFANY